jgi:hypothetical protein
LDTIRVLRQTSQGEKGDQLTPLVAKLDAIRDDINALGEKLRQALDNAVDQIVGDIRLTEISKVPAAHAAVADYLRTHPKPPTPPQVDDPNYVDARDRTSEVLTYFLGHSELAFMGGFIYAMNTRIEFMTTVAPCWFRDHPEYLNEIGQGVQQLNNYINHIVTSIAKQFRVMENISYRYLPDGPGGKPIKVPDTVTFSVEGPSGLVWSSGKIPAGDDAAVEKARKQADANAWQNAAAMQAQATQPYNRIVAGWNELVVKYATTAIQHALLPNAATVPSSISAKSLEIMALRVDMNPLQTNKAANNVPAVNEKTPRLELPLRDVVLAVLGSTEFQDRYRRSLQDSNGRSVNLWFRNTLQRDPTGEEAATLQNVLTLFGHKAFFYCLGYSHEYEERWGKGLPPASTWSVVEEAGPGD